MKCPKCLSKNREEAKFCNVCGHKFELPCPKCSNVNKPGSRFCDECGHDLNKAQETSPIQPREIIAQPEKSYIHVEGERKYVTVLFSDLSGYTDMSEKLDPEEVKEIMSKIFGEIARSLLNMKVLSKNLLVMQLWRYLVPPKHMKMIRSGPSWQPERFTTW